MHAREWQDKFSSIVRQTETNLDRVKLKLSSAKLNRTLPTENVGNFMTPDQLTGSVSGFPVLESYSAPPAIPRHKMVEATESTMTMSPLFSIPAANINDNAKYVPLHESSAVMTSLMNKLDEQNKKIDDLVKLVKKNEEEKDAILKELNQLKGERFRAVRDTDKDTEFIIEQKLNYQRQEAKVEFKLIDQKYNSLKNQLEEAIADVESRNMSLSNSVCEVQKRNQREVDSVKQEMDLFEQRLSRIENELSQLKIKSHNTPQLNGYDALVHDSWPTRNRPLGFRGKNSVTFLHDFSDNRQEEMSHSRAPLDDIKKSFKNLQRKLSSIETEILPDSEPSSPDYKKKRQKHKSFAPKSILAPTASDIDVSTATDLVTLSYTIDGKSNGLSTYDPDLTTLASDLSSEDDLTLDDL